MPVPVTRNGVTIFEMTPEEKKQDIIRKLEDTKVADEETEDTDRLARIESKLDKIISLLEKQV